MIIYKKAITITWICCYVHSVHIPKQTNRMKVDVLNRVFILRVSCLKQGHGFNPSAAQLYSNTGQEPPQDSGLSLFCILFYHTNPTLLCPLPQSSSTSMSSRPSTSTCPTLYPSWSYTLRSSPLTSINCLTSLGCVSPSTRPIRVGYFPCTNQCTSVDSREKNSTMLSWKPRSSSCPKWCQVLQNPKHVMPFYCK